MISWNKEYCWKPPSVAYKLFNRCSICLKYNPGKSLHRSQRHFLWREATALMRGKLLLEKIISNWGIPTELQSDLGTHFTEQIIQSIYICNIFIVLITPSPLDLWNISKVQSKSN